MNVMMWTSTNFLSTFFGRRKIHETQFLTRSRKSIWKVLKWWMNKLINNWHLFTQAELLLRYLRNDPRRVAKNHALSDLRMLASGAPHMWKVEHVEVSFVV